MQRSQRMAVTSRTLPPRMAMTKTPPSGNNSSPDYYTEENERI